MLRFARRQTNAFTLMEIIVASAVVLVLLAIAIPVYTAMRQRSNRESTLAQMRTLGASVATYVNQNNDTLPEEDVVGDDTWINAAKPESKEAWYNALPRLIGKKGVGDYASSATEFYTKENILYVPGAEYPEGDKKMRYPLFAIAYNTKLHRKDAEGRKVRVKKSEITNPQRTVVLLEQGLPGETKTLAVQSKKDYDGSPKGSAKSFVGRYGGKGILYFVDGHAEVTDAKDVLTETGRFPYPQTFIVWTPKSEDDPNK